MGAPVYIPTVVYEGFGFSTSQTTLVITHLFYFGRSSGCEVLPLVAWTCISLMATDVSLHPSLVVWDL